MLAETVFTVKAIRITSIAEDRRMPNEAELYTIDDLVATCNACGAFTLTREPKDIKHYLGCGGLAEVEKWNKYYSDPERQKAVESEE